MKAYDSVDREFLYAVLLWLGFPPAFVALMRAMHTGTKVRFLANGFRSRWVSVLCGIRQGCPLAPLLFILVLEALYRRVDAHPRLQGIELSSREGQMRLKVGGYADDTANYVKSATEVPVVMAITAQFARASGLHLNQKKTMVIALNPDQDVLSIVLPEPLRIQGADQLSRYLGIQVGSKAGMANTWELAYKQVRVRLLLAGQKTNTVDQRSMLAAAIVVPKLLYIGRHQWPSEGDVIFFQKCIHNFVWFGHFSASRKTGRAWLNVKVASMPREHGGIAEPNLLIELQAMAAMAMADWALTSTSEARIVGDILGDSDTNPAYRHFVIGPRLLSMGTARQRLGTSLWSTGAAVCGTYGCGEFDADKAWRVHALFCLTYFRGHTEVNWCRRVGLLDLSVFRGAIWEQCIRQEAALQGTLCAEWLPHLPLRAMRLISPDGIEINPNTRYRALCRLGRQLKDLVHWTWTDTGDLKLTLLTAVNNTAVCRQVGHLMLMLVLNFPQMMTRGAHDGVVRYTTKEILAEPFPIRLTREKVLECATHATAGTGTSTVVTTHRALESGLQALLGSQGVLLRAHPHPRLARMVCLWNSGRRWAISRKKIKRRLSGPDLCKGRKLIAKAAIKWHRHSLQAAAGLDKLHWSMIRRIVGLNPWGEQVIYRLKHHALSAFNPGAAGLLCPHPECGRLGRIDLYHIFWTCPAATQLRKLLCQCWQAAGIGRGTQEQAIFSLQLAEIPPDLLQFTGEILAEGLDTTSGRIEDAVEKIAGQCWSVDAATYLHCVWQWHVAFFDSHEVTSRGEHEAILLTKLRRNHATIAYNVLPDPHDRTMRRLRRGICEMLAGKTARIAEGRVRSGSRIVILHAGTATAEDKPGEAGVLIVETHWGTRRLKVLYMQGLRPEGTLKNGATAAHIGLLHGLRVCQRRGWRHVHVAGDNAAVVRQQGQRMAPKDKTQRAMFWTARRTADAIGVNSWVLLPREKNRASRGIMTQHWKSEVADDTSHRDSIMTYAAEDLKYWWTRTDVKEGSFSNGSKV